MTITLQNYKEWLPFAFIVAGVLLALIAPLLPHRKVQRQKAMKLVNTFRATLHEHDLQHWKEVYAGTRMGIVAPPGHYINPQGKPVRLDSLWASGDDDQTAIQRMAEGLEVLCAELLLGHTEAKIVWYEIGQLLQAMHAWLSQIQGVQQELTFLDEQYPSIKQVFEKHEHQFKHWPYRVYDKK